jgi:hypothetical protein
VARIAPERSNGELEQVAILQAEHSPKRCLEGRPCVVLSKHVFGEVRSLVGINSHESLHHAFEWLLDYGPGYDECLDEMIQRRGKPALEPKSLNNRLDGFLSLGGVGSLESSSRMPISFRLQGFFKNRVF